MRGESIKPSSPLFLSREGGPISPNRFENVWHNTCLEAGVDRRPITVKGRFIRREGVMSKGIQYNVRPHSLRKFFRTALAISGVDRIVAEALMGHSLSQFGVESIYNYATSRADYLRGEYLKALNNLLFLKEPKGMEIINGVARKRIEELEQKVEALTEAVKSYEGLVKLISKKNPKLLKELGLT